MTSQLRFIGLVFVLIFAVGNVFSQDAAKRREPQPQVRYELGEDSKKQTNIPEGQLTGPFLFQSKIIENTVRKYWVSVPSQYDSKQPACVLVFQDGARAINPNGVLRVPQVLENLIAKKLIPVTIGIYITPGQRGAEFPVSIGTGNPDNRDREYDVLDDKYARMLIDEILPEVAAKYNLTTDPKGRAIGGSSSGGICAFTVAWHRPDQFRNVISLIGSFTNIHGGHVYPQLVRDAATKPIRVFLQDGVNDNRRPNDLDRDWHLQNQAMVAALNEKKYDMAHVFGDGGHSDDHGGAILPEMLQWIWRDYPGVNSAGAEKLVELARQRKPVALITPIGEFESASDVGAVSKPGSASFDSDTQSYEIIGSGTNMWANKDHFHMVWKKLKGDFILDSHVKLFGVGVDPHRKLGWIIRKTLDTDSAYADSAIHGDGLTSLQFRRVRGGITEQVQSNVKAPDVVQLSRKGTKISMAVAHSGDALESVEGIDLDLGDEVYVGLYVCSHNPDVLEKGVFSNVRITIPAPSDFKPYREYIGSRLEILNVNTGHRTVVHTVSDSMQAPNWTPDGKSLIYNRNGKLYRFQLADRSVTEINTDFATRNNNDHVLSFDGKRLGISHHSTEHGGKSMIYSMPIGGGKPKLLTTAGPSYLHGWSPDGRFLVFTGQRNDELDIYKISSDGGDEVRLTTAKGVDDGSEYTPDGKFIVFNSTRTGKMQLWKMNTDGSAQTRITDDRFNNWFPHVSPDGKSLVYLSFMEDVEPTDHPFYKPVYLRQQPIEGGPSRIIAYLYGGQGTINVNSWSPDNQHVAFVSNSKISKEAAQ